MSVTLYGIKNCDKVRAARQWLTREKIDHIFIDFREEALDVKHVKTWLDAVGLEVLLNKRSKTWKQLLDEEKVMEPAHLLIQYPTLIKRPVLEQGDVIQVGFSEQIYQAIF